MTEREHQIVGLVTQQNSLEKLLFFVLYSQLLLNFETV